MPRAQKLDDRIPALSLNSEMGDVIMDALSHDKYQEKIKNMLKDYCVTVEFEELVMKYAGKEYDNRILKSGRFWFTTILTTVVTSSVSAIIAFLIARN